MANPLFSVVIPTHDRPEYLAEAVASVLSQRMDDLECVVVDDGGEVEAAVPSDPRVRLVRRATNAGPGAARNLGVERSAGRYLTFLDDDDVYTPERLELALEGLERAPVALCWGVWMDDDLAPSGRRLQGDVYDSILDHITPPVSTVALARDGFTPFDETYPASAELAWWLDTTRDRTVATVERIGVRLRRHDAPRHRNSPSARITASQRLLVDREDYFTTHRRARSFRQLRIGLVALAEGRRGLAARSFVRSFRTRPRVQTLWHLARAGAPWTQPRSTERRTAASQSPVSTER